MTTPDTRYAESGDVHIAYQVSGDGPLDLVVVPGWVSHLEYQWEEPLGTRFFQRLASFARLIRFDKRGTGPAPARCWSRTQCALWWRGRIRFEDRGTHVLKGVAAVCRRVGHANTRDFP